MSSPSFQDYLHEYETKGVGPLLYGLILDIVDQTSKHYPPEIYCPNQRWDEDAIVAMAHDFTMDKLITAGWLEHHLLAQETVQGLKQSLGRDYRHFLISRRQRTEYLNLYERVKKILADDNRFVACYEHHSSAATLWGLAAWNSKDGSAAAQDVADVVEAMFEVELPPLVRYRADSKKLSHLLYQQDLTRLLESTFSIVGECIRMELLMEALRYRLGLFETGSVSLEEPVGSQHENGSRTYASITASEVDIEAAVTDKEAAQDIFERLSDRQRHIFVLYWTLQPPTLEAIGEVVGVSKSTVHNDLQTVLDHISFTTDDQEEAERTISHLSEMCGRYIAETNGRMELD